MSEQCQAMPAGLSLLARCATVSRDWRAAVEAAVETVTSVCLGYSSSGSGLPASALSSPLLASWAGRWTHLELYTGEEPVMSPDFPGFLQDACTALRSMSLGGRP